MSDEELERLYKAHVTHTHLAAIRAIFEAGRTSAKAQEVTPPQVDPKPPILPQKK